MNGTAKQIEYASEIKAAALPLIAEQVAAIKASPKFSEALHGMYITAADKLMACGKASFWIDEKDAFKSQNGILLLLKMIALGKASV